ncbi:MAG: helix-turn-helix domain-containing protein [Clostridia bacterium]|nr:helix-turn-helix domain-containing protein [Clostridia bacterium]
MIVSKNYSFEDLTTELLTAKELKKVMRCGINRAYDLLRSPAFPSIKIGGRYYVTVSALKEWLEYYENKVFYL